MNRLLLVILLLVASLSVQARSFQQENNITGIVTDHDSRPLSGVTVILHPSNEKTETDEKGMFRFEGILEGEYHLIFNSLGYLEVIKNLIYRNAPVILEVQMNPSKRTILQAVEVVGRAEKEYKNSVSYGGTKTAAEIKDVPQSIQYVTKELMQDQGAVRMTDIVKNISGVNQHTFYDDVTIRGFRNQGGVGSSSSNQLFNGLRTFNGFWRQNLLNYLERVEVIKGPAAALFGNVNPGGTINKVTKKPLATTRCSLNFQVGNYATMRTN